MSTLIAAIGFFVIRQLSAMLFSSR
jgi:hypothetical protein